MYLIKNSKLSILSSKLSILSNKLSILSKKLIISSKKPSILSNKLSMPVRLHPAHGLRKTVFCLRVWIFLVNQSAYY